MFKIIGLINLNLAVLIKFSKQFMATLGNDNLVNFITEILIYFLKNYLNFQFISTYANSGFSLDLFIVVLVQFMVAMATVLSNSFLIYVTVRNKSIKLISWDFVFDSSLPL